MGNLERIFDLNKPQAQRKYQSPNAVNIFNGNGLIFYAKAKKTVNETVHDYSERQSQRIFTL